MDGSIFGSCSGDGVKFGFSTIAPGVLAFSRILNDREVLVVANFNKAAGVVLSVVVDSVLSPQGRELAILYSNNAGAAAPGNSAWNQNAKVSQPDGSVSQGAFAARVNLAAGEIQILG